MRSINNNQPTKILTHGFTLIEVLVFISILALFFISAAAITISSLRFMQVNQHKILATRYAEEALEWLRAEKEEDWPTFQAAATGTYCFNTLDWNTTGPCPNVFGSPSIFKREATFNSQGSQITAVITVSWEEVGNHYQVPIRTVFAPWE